MKKILLITLICFSLTSCRQALTPDEKKLVGQWMLVEDRGNRQWYTLKHDGTFTDDRFGENEFLSSDPISFSMKDSMLLLKYRSFVIFHPVSRFKISELTDSSMTLIRPKFRKFLPKTYYLKKMKLNGKFIIP